MRLSIHTHNKPAADPRLTKIQTPLIQEAWSKSLCKHPDGDFVKYIRGGLENGFQIGVDETRPFSSSQRNMQSATENPSVIFKYISKENSLGNILGPFLQEMAGKVHISLN